jgi:hypothetical protein
MELNLFDSSEVHPAELAATTARCYLALGRLDGAIAHAAPNVVALFALMLMRRTLARSLAAAGYLFTDATFEAWIARAGGAPRGGPGTAAPAPAIAAALMSVHPIRQIAGRSREGRGRGTETDWEGSSLRRGGF